VTFVQLGEFNLHSGRKSIFKIDCDALDDASIEAIAALATDRLPPFRAVEGVPMGGLRLAAAMERWVRPYAGNPLLIVDDVLTSGASMEEARAGRWAIGFVIVARGLMPGWVRSLFEIDRLWG
jgi:orotate phosphoribosyltransferase